MGCDIHMTAEWRDSVGAWTTDLNRLGYDGLTEYDYCERNYDLFAILADVRNGRGFAGTKTGEGFVPISAPRGVPEDASEAYRDWVASWGSDGHSHSYITIAEIMTYDWTQTTQLQGYVGPQELARWALTGEPHTYVSDVWGREVTKYEGADAASDLRAAGFDLRSLLWGQLSGVDQEHFSEMFPGDPHFLVKWKKSYAACARGFLGEFLPRLWRLGKPEDVRVVFFFDN